MRALGRARAGRAPGDRDTLGRAAIAFCVVLLWAGLACAAEGAEERPPSITLLLLNFINFGLYAFILYWFAWPPIQRYLKERRAGVVAALEAARKARAEAEALRAEYEAKLRTIEADAARARAEVLATAELEAQTILEQARQSAERVRRDARLVAEQEVNRARHLLLEESAARVAQIAGEMIAKQMTEQDQARFVADFVQQTGAALPPGGSER